MQLRQVFLFLFLTLLARILAFLSSQRYEQYCTHSSSGIEHYTPYLLTGRTGGM